MSCAVRASFKLEFVTRRWRVNSHNKDNKDNNNKESLLITYYLNTTEQLH